MRMSNTKEEKKKKTTKEKNTKNKVNKVNKDIIKLLNDGKKIKLFFVGKTDFFVNKLSIMDNLLKKTEFVFADSDGNTVSFVLGNMHIAFSELEVYKAYTVQYDNELRQYKFVPAKGFNDKVVDKVLKDNNNELIKENNFILKQIKYEKGLNTFVYIEILIFLVLLYVVFFVEWSIGIVGIIIEIVLYYIIQEIMYLCYKKYYESFLKGSE